MDERGAAFAPQSDRNLLKDDANGNTEGEGRLRKQAIGLLLVPGFSLMSYTVAIEPLRAANRLSGRALYRWCNISLDGAAAEASNGTMILADHRVGDDLQLDMLLVCAGGNPAMFDDRPTLRWLRMLAHKGIRIGGISGGPYILARAGLLAGHRCTIHWEHIPAFVEDFPDLQVTRTLYEIDRDRLSCAGGIAALDMMHALIETDHGHALAAAVSDWYLHSQVRVGSGPQRMTLRERYGVSHPKLLRILEEMEARIEEPASREELAALVGVSVRQLERLFATHLGSSFGEHSIGIRLDRAQALLRQTAMPVLAVAVACGFVSASHFSRSYRQRFGHPPRSERVIRKPAPAT
jgi:transcriptional regulator GlxA family with amidase domain